MTQTRVDVVEVLAEMVRIPSVEPTQAGDQAAEWGGEARMGRYVADFMERAGYRVEWQWVAEGRPNVICKGGAENPERIWLVEGHMDTVGVEGMRYPPFEGAVREGRLWGRGAADCKGPLAAGMVACAGADLEELARKGEAIWFIGSMGEETGNNGARASLEVLPERVWRTIALEPTEAAVVHASKGFAVLEVDIEGRSAHGSNPEVGLNAIYGAQVFTDRLRALCEREGERYGSELTGRPSVNLGLIRGGIAANVVAPRCHLEFDWRTVPPETIGEVKEKIGALLESMKEEGVILGWEMRQQQNNEALWTSGDSGLVRELSAALQAAGLEGRKAGVRWCCDASIYCPRSDETVIFGPGSIRQGHATEEFIDVDELRRGTDGLGRLWPRRSP